MLLISEKPTKQTITLQGKIGYENGIKTLDKLCRDITGIEEVRNLTIDDIINSKYWEDEKKKDLIFGKDTDFKYWLASPYVGTSVGYADFGLRYVGSGDVSNYDYLYSSDGDAGSCCYGVRAVVSLKSEI